MTKPGDRWNGPGHGKPVEEAYVVKLTVRQRLLAKVDRQDCWIWTGSVDRGGYARIKVAGRNKQAHVVAYAVFIGPVPEGMEIDHACHTRDLGCAGGDTCPHRSCVNPEHLEAVTRAENVVRQTSRITHCPRGHEYTPENTNITPSGHRDCRACDRVRRKVGA